MSKQRREDPNRYPAGWDAERVKRVRDHYEKQSDTEAAREDNAVWRESAQIAVPHDLLPAVRKLIAKRAPVRTTKRTRKSA